MKAPNKYFILFLITFTVYAILFRIILSAVLSQNAFTMAIIVGIAYFIIVFITSWFLGKAYTKTNILMDIGFKFHISAYLLWGITSELWFLYGNPSRYESILTVHYTLLFWGVGLLTHFIMYILMKKHTIKGIAKYDAFE